MKRIISIFSILSVASLLVGCVEDLDISVEFAKPVYEVSVGDTLDLSAEVKVENSLTSPVFVSSDKKVATVISAGRVVAVAAGEAVITAEVEGKSATTQLKVSLVNAESIAVEAPEALTAGLEWTSITAKVEPANFDCSNLEWTFTPSDAAMGFESKMVSDAEYQVRASSYVEGGKITVTVKDKNSDLSKTVEIFVSESETPAVPAKIVRLIAPDYITESKTTWGYVTAEAVPDGAGEYDYANLVWKFTPSEGFESEVEYEMMNGSQYKLRFKSYMAGASVGIEVTDTIGGKFALKTVSVAMRPEKGLSSIAVSPEAVSLFVGDEPLKLAVNCDPVNYDQSLLTIQSSNTDVVRIQGDKIVAVGPGQAVIKVTDSISQLSDECVVTVETPVTDVEVKRIVLETSRLTLKAQRGDYQLKAVCYDEDGNEVKGFAGLIWSATEDIGANGVSYEVVEVSKQGIITPKAAGNTVVTVAVEANQAVRATCDVNVQPKEITVEKLWLSPAENTIDVGDIYTLMVTSEPDFSTVDDKTIVYVSSNPQVATVSADGHVKGMSYGEAIITATAASGAVATSKVTVQEMQGEVEEKEFEILLSIENESEGVNMTLPQFETLNISLAYTNGYVPTEARWESSDPSLATVTAQEGGAVVNAVYDGMMESGEKKSVTITHYAGNKVASKTIDITRALPKSIEIVGLPENNTLYLGQTFGPDFRAVVYPAQANQYVTWWGDNAAYGVANGSWVARHAGYWKLAATATEGNTSVTAEVYVTFKYNTVEGGVLSNTMLDLEVGKEATLIVDFTPLDSEYHDYNVAWSSSDSEVATVEQGKVTAVAEGTATISATLSNGDVLTCEVTVTEPAPIVVYVGDYYYSDGTTSTELDASKTVIGVVFSVENPTQMGDTKLAADHPGATHGLVVALEETANIKWQAAGADVAHWLIENESYHHITDTDRKCGYSNTSALQAYNASCSEDNKVLVADCAPEVELGASTSGWYLPSYAELKMLVSANNAQFSAGKFSGEISARLEAAGGTPLYCERQQGQMSDGQPGAVSYWSSTESSTNAAYIRHCYFHSSNANNWVDNVSKSKDYNIARYIFAF